MTRMLLAAGLLLLAAATVLGADKEFSRQFEQDYEKLYAELLNNPGEKAEVSNFVYKKDVATFTFDKGTMYLQRYVQDRPTTAVFVGTGRATVEVPVHAERQGLWAVAKDSTVDETFELLVIRMADDLDLKLKEQFTFTPTQFDWRALTSVKGSNQGEFFFKPDIQHHYDNYFRLAMSVYERKADGFFWADFNRYLFIFDPNWPEQVQVAYEFEGGDPVATTAASFQRQENGKYDDSLLSQIPYPLTALSMNGNISLSGTDGRRIDRAEVTIDLAVNADSLKYTWFNLMFNLSVDSVAVDGERVHSNRRRSFDYTGIILPRYYRAGDTLQLTVWYRGTNFDHFLPTVADPTPCPINVTLQVPDGYNYYMSGMSEPTKIGGGKTEITSAFPLPLHEFYFHCYPAGVDDTVQEIADIGLTLNYVVADRNFRNLSCFIPHPMYRTSVSAAFNFMGSRFGQPPQTFAEYIIPEGFQSMPGMIKVPQIACITSDAWKMVGAFDLLAGEAVARQWFGATLRPRSTREDWLLHALPVFLGLQYIEAQHSSTEYFTDLMARRDSLYNRLDVAQDIHLAAGERVNSYLSQTTQQDFYRTIMINKGAWLLHMLRFLLYDHETGSEATFAKFQRELFLLVNNKVFTNADLIRVAEKHYGQSLDWFFRKYLYGAYLPEFDVKWSIQDRDGAWYIPVSVQTAKVGPDFRMPVIVRVVDGAGQNVFSRPVIEGTSSTFELGPFASEPSSFIFNEFLSVLGRETVSKR